MSSSALSIASPPKRSDNIELLPLDTHHALTLKNRVLKQLHLFFYISGLSFLYAQLRAKSKQDAATILMYHSVPEPSASQWIDPCNSMSPKTFEQQMRFLAERRHVISIEDLIHKIELGEPIRQGTVAITFDDGYRDNLTVAAPILARYDLPATIYLATDYITASRNQWIDTLYAAFRARAKHQLSLPRLGDWALTNSANVRTAYQAIADHLTQTTIERQSLLETIDAQLAPTAYPPRLTLNWEDARQLQQQYPNITLGVHTANHIDLRAHPDKTDAEMKLSIQQFEAAMGDRPNHLAFPYNRYSPQAQRRVANYLKSAVVAAPDPVVRGNTSLYALPRIEAAKSITMIKSWTDGGFPHLSQKLLGRSWTLPY